MNPPPSDPRPCERQCRICGLWKHHSRFRQKGGGHGSISTIKFASDCKDCETKKRNERKNEDRPRSIIERRARDRARRSDVSFTFVWVNLNWRALVPVYRAMLTDEARCLSCGHPFDNERDIQLEHGEPPRDPQDWARHHARNIGIACGSCNGTKTNKSRAQWLDDQEQARLSNQTTPVEPLAVAFEQATIFDELNDD